MSVSVAAIMSPKEDSELTIMKKACQVSVDIFNKYLKDQVMDIIDAEKVITIMTIQSFPTELNLFGNDHCMP